jgi:hypothetical protein
MTAPPSSSELVVPAPSELVPPELVVPAPWTKGGRLVVIGAAVVTDDVVAVVVFVVVVVVVFVVVVVVVFVVVVVVVFVVVVVVVVVVVKGDVVSRQAMFADAVYALKDLRS